MSKVVRGQRGLGIGGHTAPVRGGTDDWITPPEINKALGPFDLDPCASLTQPWPMARESFTVDQDGLAQEWSGRVWLNPPYGPEAADWLARLAEHGLGTALIFARTETGAFHRYVWGVARAVLFLAGRLFFYRPDGTKAEHNAGGPSCLVAYGYEDVAALERGRLPGALVNRWTPIRHLTNKEEER